MKGFRILLVLTLGLLGSTGLPELSARAGLQRRGVDAITNAGPAWYDGQIHYSTITNCVSIIQGFPYQENGAGASVGFVADPEAGQPAPNTTYYTRVLVGGLGNSCSGMRVFVDIALPQNTSLAITGGTPVRCYYNGAAIPPAECPQSLPPSSYNLGAYWIPSPDSAHANTWPLPQGQILELHVPVKSTTALSGSTLQGNVWVLDGNSSPWLHPQQGVYVFGGSSTPVITYNTPSTIQIQANRARSEAILYSYNITGTGYFQLGTTTAYGLINESVPIPAGQAWLAYDEWDPVLQPDTLYHWRFIFTTSGGTYYGVDQTFRTLPNGRVSATVGNGTPANCTDANLASALSTATDIDFNCGSAPVTIALQGAAHSIAATVKIEGGSKVTLDAQSQSRHFTVQASAHLTLQNISLINGHSDSECGGSVYVPANAQLTLNGARFLDNATFDTGGALCVDPNGTAGVQNSLFSRNHADFAHGGAIRSYGSTAVSNTVFIDNTAGINGGGIDNTGTLTVTASTFTNNTAGFRGGGINNYLGSATVTGNSFTGNIATNAYGGGISNDGSMTASQNTFARNSTNGSGGGVQSSGTLTLVNNTISSNSAAVNGGGVHWALGQVTILNSTIVNNTAGVQGGNIDVGGVHNAGVSLKNTIVGNGSPNNCSSTVLSNGYNLETRASCGLAAAGDLANSNPALGPLQQNGGPTTTHALLSGSPAINAGTNAGCPATDERGTNRPVAGTCDIGAYEGTLEGSAFTDALLTTATPVRLVHVSELRTRINAVRASNSLSAFSWTDPTLVAGVTPIRAVHFAEMRTAVDAAYTASGLTPPIYANAVLTAGATIVKYAHVMELRGAVMELEPH